MHFFQHRPAVPTLRPQYICVYFRITQELVQKSPSGESEALRQPEEAALSGLTGDTIHLMCRLQFLVFECKPGTSETPVGAANNLYNLHSEI